MSSTNPNQPPYPHLKDYREIVKGRHRLIIPKNPKTRYRPSTWTSKKPTGYTIRINAQDLEDTQRDIGKHYAFVRAELARGLLTI